MHRSLIEKVEIRSFRSVYHATLEDCKQLNILVGGNDSGKSNILRALNLFFNDETDLETYHYWETDYSIASNFEQNKRHHKKEIEIKVTFNNIFKYGSLPAKFEVKKTWDRDGKRPEPVYTGQENFNKATLTRFLNQITLYYIPAIKDSETFANCLEKIHDALGEKDTDFSEKFKDLQSSINNATSALSKEIQKALGIDSRIVFPANLKEIFGDLDFSTQVQNSYEKVSLHQRGDGIQARHIPYILDFISQQSEKKVFIWLYEEPENSLELRRAFDLAQAFKNDFSKRNQIFLTTHSPAFYSLEGDNISRYQIIKQSRTINGKETGSAASTEATFSVSTLKQLTELKDIDESLGLTVLVADRAKEAYESIEKLTQEINKNIEKIKDLQKPVILCEGKSDVLYIKKALELFGKTELIKQCDIMEACQDNAGSGCANLKKIYDQYKKSPQLFKASALFVFDCDVTYQLEETDKACIFYFTKHVESPFSAGIENALSLKIAQKLKENTDLWDEETKDKGAKEVTVRELKKDKAARFICEKNDKSDFSLFSPLINKIEEFLKINFQRHTHRG